jgi:hypothetical protein
MTAEWTETVARACRWGWWGFNTDRVKHIQKRLRDERKAAVIEKAKEEADAGGKGVEGGWKIRVEIPSDGGGQVPDTPRSTSGQLLAGFRVQGSGFWRSK